MSMTFSEYLSQIINGAVVVVIVRQVVGFTTIPMQSVPITTDVVSSKLDQGEVYNII